MIAMYSSPSREIHRRRNRCDNRRKGRLACRVEWIPTSMLSATDRVANTRPFWKVRATPCSAIRAVSPWSIRRPSRLIVPPLAGIVPVTRFSVVVLPDPLGPMIETTSRGATVNEIPSTALRPSK